MSKELRKGKRETCLTTLVKCDILTNRIELDFIVGKIMSNMQSITLKYVVEEAIKTDCLKLNEGGQNNEFSCSKGIYKKIKPNQNNKRK